MLKLLCTYAFFGIFAASFAKTTPYEIVEKSMEMRRKVPFILIHSSPMSEANSTRLVVKWEQDGKGFTRSTVISPLSMQGTTSIIDPKNWTTVYPDKKKIVRGPSQGLVYRDLEARKALLKRNYRLNFEREGQVASRAVFIIKARPRESGMVTRKFSIDKKAFVMLRSEAESSRNKYSIVLDTFSAEFPEDVKVDTSIGQRTDFELIVQGNRPFVNTFEQAQSYFQWNADFPKKPVMGFAVEQVIIMKAGPKGLAGVRLTDGLNSVTIYVWNKKFPPNGFNNLNFPKKEVGEFHMMIAGDMPSSFHEKLLDAISKDLKDTQDFLNSGTTFTGLSVIPE